MRAHAFPTARAGRTPDSASLVGLDWGHEPGAARLRTYGWRALLAVLVAAFTLVALRVELIRLQYSLAESIAREETLLAQERELTVTMRKLRHPGRLARRARQLGFGAPERVVELPVRANQVAAGPPPEAGAWRP